MHTEVAINFGVLYSFLVVLARVSGFFVFVPLPGINAVPASSRIVLALALTFCLLPLWPPIEAEVQTGELVIWAIFEFAIGLVTGVGVAFLLESFQVAAQSIGLQAGFSYASTIDPSTQADIAVLQTVLQLFSGVLFFALGLDRHVLRLLAIGLDGRPSRAVISKVFNPQVIIQFGSWMLGVGMRLALPVMGFLVILDLTFAVLSKVHSQLQLLSLSFSVKMLAGLAMFAATLSLCPSIMENAAARTFGVLARLLS